MTRWIRFVAPALLAVSLGAQARVAGDVAAGVTGGSVADLYEAEKYQPCLALSFTV